MRERLHTMAEKLKLEERAVLARSQHSIFQPSNSNLTHPNEIGHTKL